MSWQLAAFSILALALASGFAWYERTRPDARLVALVGTLAAFAALGRVAFAALPNVKPTTDIVLISGYALGAAPGFAVGALAGLTSNFFFGQGPWTPWQMAAWGATGLVGAGIGRFLLGSAAAQRSQRRSWPRWPLALVCALVGFAFAALQDLGDWVSYSDHSAAQLGIYLGRGVGFDLVHAGGCFAFALTFGPALARSLRRFGARLHVTWRPAGVLSAILVLGLLGQAGSMAVAAPARAATPLSYLLGAQHRDGGFGSGSGEPSSTLYTGWATLGIAALGQGPQDTRRGGPSALDYVRATVDSVRDVGALERTILVVRAAGASARDFAGRDLLTSLKGHIRPDGSVGGQVNLTAFAILALKACGASPSERTLSWLARQQDSDGGFGFATAGSASDVDDSGAVLEALAGADGSADRARTRAMRFIAQQQNPDGGFPSQPGGDSNVQSTAWAIQGVIAAGMDPNSLHRAGAVSPLRYLSSLIGVDGHVRYSRSSDQTPVWVTAEAALALAGKPLPLTPVAQGPVARRAKAGPASGARAATPGRAKPSRRGAHGPRRARTAGRGLLGLAAGAGALTALLLAPVGLG